MLLEKQVTINGTVDLNQFKLTGSEDEYELNVLFPRVDVGALQYTNVVLNLAPDTAQIHLSELISDANRSNSNLTQLMQHSTLNLVDSVGRVRGVMVRL